MDLHISLVGRKDLGGEIYRQLRRAIIDGRLRPGDPLPPTRELAQRLHVSRTTVTGAYDRLAGESFVTSRIGAGTFVSEQVARVPRETKKHRTGGMLRPPAIWDSIDLFAPFARPAQFDFRTGLPDASLFPHEIWRRAMMAALRGEAMSRGMYGDPAGHRGLREAIARHIGVSRGVEASADDVTITSGTQQAVDVVARVMLAPGDRVAVEDPGYVPIRRLLTSLGARVHGVPLDGSGLIVDALPRNIRVVYVTPSHQYPLGVAMSLSRRIELLDWAEHNDAAIIEDDYDSEFRFEGRPIEPLQTLDTRGRVIYVGSFSKTLLPSMRLGFVVAPPTLRSAIHKAKQLTDWHTSMLAQGAMAQFIDDGGFARHIRKMGNVYRVRHEMVTNAVSGELSEYLEIIPSAAGLHVAAVALHASANKIRTVVRRASENGVEVQELAQFAVDQPTRPGLALGYGAISTTQIGEGVRRLRRAFRA
ncbi:MAG TPA: PLP-dependent aminotransferase family protein [Gemmatimonadaceae bacterium]|nr:PLP-dependent aminotransferase family protein [Gemmatimonadaceae bacterium]